jgi:hypothetical protein
VDIVYHYTDSQALKGVVENAALWATDFRYLNDSQELIYTWAAFVERLEQLAAELSQHAGAYRAQLEALKRMNAVDLMQFDDALFVACFTELADVASQWIGYGANGRGFALGFNADLIRSPEVPQHRYCLNGQLTPMTATVGGGPNSGQTVEMKWNAFLRKVAYGEGARDLVVDGLTDSVRAISEESGTFDNNVGNCI